jgi:hypothetical protein
VRVNKGRTVELRAQLVQAVLKLLYYCQPEDAVLVLDEARASYRTFDEIYAEKEAKAKEITSWDDGNFG